MRRINREKLKTELREFCAQYGLTFKWISAQIGINPKNLSHFLNGQRGLNDERAAFLADFMRRYRKRMAKLLPSE